MIALLGMQPAPADAPVQPSTVPAVSSPSQAPELPEPPPEDAAPERVPVLLYHHLDPEADGINGAVISPAAFAAQMAWLAENGYTAIDTGQLAAWLLADGALPPKPVLISFDDGYRSVYEHAYPILREYGLKMTLFLTAGKVGTRPGIYDYITWDDIREMQEAGRLDLQSHTYDAHYLADGQAVLTVWDREQIQADSSRLARAFQDHGIAPARAYAYPYGAYDEEVVAAVAGDGFDLGFTVAEGMVERGSDRYTLPRLTVFPWTSMCAFQAMVTGEDRAVVCARPPADAGSY